MIHKLFTVTLILHKLHTPSQFVFGRTHWKRKFVPLHMCQ